MNEKFLELSKEKQLRIINAGLEIFAKYEYKHAITDDIARIAGISKGLLFHYFENKKAFYMYLFRYCKQKIMDEIIDDSFHQIDDFFVLIRYGAEKKMKLLVHYPLVMGFVFRTFHSKNESISEDINEVLQDANEEAYEIYFKNIDFTKFKEGVAPKKIYEMMTWMSEGYLLEKQRRKQPLRVEEMMNEFSLWEEAFKKMAYKEEYL